MKIPSGVEGLTAVVVTRSSEETLEAGKEFAARLKEGDVVALFGPLGGGKTTFVKGIATGLKAKDAVTSPTFVLLNVYSLDKLPSTTPGTGRDKSGKISLYHFDFYRLEQPSQLEALNLDDYLCGGGVCLIEWPELALPYLDRPFYKVKFEIAGENERRIEIGTP